MGKTGKWWKSFLVGKKEDKEKKEKEREKDKPASSTPSSKEKRRWSFRRSAGKELTSTEISVSAPLNGISEVEMDQKRHTMAVAVATAAAAAVMRLTATVKATGKSVVEEAAAVKIQTAFRGYLARKALCALRGLVKLQALIRGHLVRKQASATLRCMQALVTAQERARVQRIRMLEEVQITPQRQPNRRSPQHPRNRTSHNMEKAADENIKIVEMDLGESRSISKSRYSYSTPQSERTNHRFSSYVDNHRSSCRLESPRLVSPSPSALTDISPRTCSALFEEFSFKTAESSPHYLSSASLPEPRKNSFHIPRQAISYSMPHDHDHPFYPNYMANTESSRAKARSQSAPKQRPDSFERPPSRRKSSIEGRNIPRSGRMQRSTSHVGATAHMQYPWSLKLDRSSLSLKDSECGSTSTVLTNNTHYCKSIAAFEAYGYA